jgi:hypothetical protein
MSGTVAVRVDGDRAAIKLELEFEQQWAGYLAGNQNLADVCADLAYGAGGVQVDSDSFTRNGRTVLVCSARNLPIGDTGILTRTDDGGYVLDVSVGDVGQLIARRAGGLRSPPPGQNDGAVAVTVDVDARLDSHNARDAQGSAATWDVQFGNGPDQILQATWVPTPLWRRGWVQAVGATALALVAGGAVTARRRSTGRWR